MPEASYRLIFKGEIRSGQDKETVKKNLCSLLKIGEGQAENLFSGKPFVVKKMTNAEMAEKAKSAFYKAGAILRLEDVKGEASATVSATSQSPGKSSSAAVPEKGRPRDIPALVIFISALCLFISLCGYLTWKGFDIKEMEQQVTKAVTAVVTGAVPGLKKWIGESDSAKPQKVLKPGKKPARKKPAGSATRISVSISGEFEPVSMKVSSRSGVHPKLADLPPRYLLKAPDPKGDQRKYGKLLLGTRNNRTYDFILDIVKDGRSLLYFDGNQNRDLSDDPPLENKGTGIFATVIQIPIRQLIKEMEWDGDFKIWFFTNKGLWARGTTCHYSITQMKGRVTVHGKNYQAYIAERGGNDADFTNDGIFIDLNGNGKIEANTEYFPDRGVRNIGGKDCWFDIRW